MLRLAFQGPRLSRSIANARSYHTRHTCRRMSTTSAAAAAGGGSSTAGGQQEGGQIEHTSVTELQSLLENPVLCEEVQFVDVREPWEHDTAKLPYFKLLPLSQASSWAPNIDTELDPDTETVVLCHHGMRSMQMAGFLVSKGFKTVKNVTGGIAAYSMVDRSIPEY